MLCIKESSLELKRCSIETPPLPPSPPSSHPKLKASLHSRRWEPLSPPKGTYPLVKPPFLTGIWRLLSSGREKNRLETYMHGVSYHPTVGTRIQE